MVFSFASKKRSPLRSDCVHGKAHFHELRAQGNAGKLRAAKLEYVAEKVATELVLWALAHPRRNEIFSNRKALESEWSAACPPI